MSESITIEIMGSGSRMPNPPAELLDLLTISTLNWRSGGELGYVAVKEVVEYFRTTDSGEFWFPTGLVERVRCFLESLGHAVAVIDRRRFSGKRFRHDEAMVEQLDGLEQRVAQTVIQEPRGRIVVRRRREMIEFISLVCRLYPAAQVLIAIGRRRDAARLQRELGAVLGQPVGLWLGRRTDCRVAVCTYWRLVHAIPHQWQIVVLPELDEATGKLARYGVLHMNCQRVYALERVDVQRDPYQQFVVEALAGNIIHAPEQITSNVQVEIWGTGPCRVAGTRDPLSWKRRAYWGNASRNDLIATIAKAAASGDKTLLGRLDVPDALVQSVTRGKQRILVLVESPEHGRALLERLPGWSLRTGMETSNRRSRPADGTGIIMTMVRAARTNTIPDVVIRAEGGTDPVALRGFPRATRTGGEVVLIDFRDEYDRRTAKAAQQRIHEYENRTWIVHRNDAQTHGG